MELGQRERIPYARGFLKDPNIYIYICNIQKPPSLKIPYTYVNDYKQNQICYLKLSIV